VKSASPGVGLFPILLPGVPGSVVGARSVEVTGTPDTQQVQLPRIGPRAASEMSPSARTHTREPL
jgi:hypothetical protein